MTLVIWFSNISSFQQPASNKCIQRRPRNESLSTVSTQRGPTDAKTLGYHDERSMSINGSGETTSEASQGRPDGAFPGLLRAMALLAVVAGATGSVGLTLRAGRSTPRFLLVLFVIWVLSPFVALAWANMLSKRWSVLTRATLYCVSLVITLGSLIIYGNVVLPPAGSPRAFVFVVVPPGSWLLMAIVVPIAAFISRKLSHRGAAA